MACLLSFLCLWVVSVPVMATQLTPQDYRDALTLRDRWKYLTRDVAFPAHWVGKTHDFVYRKTVKGGFAFVRENADTGAKQRAFDQKGVAGALGAARGQDYQALRLPFKTFRYADDGQSIDFEIHYVGWRCATDGSHCAKRPRTHRPRGFGVVRDLRYPANNTPHVSPDGRWEAFVKDRNLVVRSRATGKMRMLSHDGSAKNFYDPESIHWSPDSEKLVIYRVKPGQARFVTRVLSSPADQLQPEVRKQLYPKPGDRVDIEQPVLFHVESGEEMPVDDALFPNPYKLRDRKSVV